MQYDVSVRAQAVRRRDFVILTAPRSGSHMLASALDSHPDVLCFGEYAREGFPVPDYAGDMVIGEIVYEPRRLYGDGDVITDKLIVLSRNLDDIRVSRIVANQTGRYHDRKSKPSPWTILGISCFAFDIEREKKRIDSFVSRWTGKHIRVSYEGLCQNRHVDEIDEVESHRLCDFLGVARMPLRPDYSKVR